MKQFCKVVGIVATADIKFHNMLESNELLNSF